MPRGMYFYHLKEINPQLRFGKLQSWG